MSTVHKDAWMHFFRTGMEYYIAGRAGARCQLTMITGNLLHHAIEMLLKGELSKFRFSTFWRRFANVPAGIFSPVDHA
jgi:hypothetical protein